MLGIERPLNYKLPKNLNFVGFIDVIIRDEIRDRLKIIDIKTSTMGWNKWVRITDKNKSNQLLLYKQFYSKQFNFPIDKIDVEFFIVKRNYTKIWIFHKEEFKHLFRQQNTKYKQSKYFVKRIY